MHYRIIVNPRANHGKAERSIPEIHALLSQAGLTYDLVRTKGPWHAADLAVEAAQSGADVVVAAGGDGTANEVLNGLMRMPRSERNCAMGVLCVGRGNDFAFGTGIPSDLAAGVQVLAQDYRSWVDVGRAAGGDYPGGRYFGNGIGIGFDAVVGFVAARMKRLRGFLGYIVATLRTVFIYYPAPTVSVAYGDAASETRHTLELPALMVSVMNGRRMGGGFLMAPKGEPADGLLDLCVARQVSRLGVFGMVPHFMRGTQSTQQPITTGQASYVVVTSQNGGLPAHADGETLCTNGRRLEISLLASELEIVSQAP